MTMGGRWTGGVWAWSRTRWCAAACRSTTRTTRSCLSLSSWRRSSSHERCRPTPSRCCQGCSSRTPTNGTHTSNVETHTHCHKAFTGTGKPLFSTEEAAKLSWIAALKFVSFFCNFLGLFCPFLIRYRQYVFFLGWPGMTHLCFWLAYRDLTPHALSHSTSSCWLGLPPTEGNVYYLIRGRVGRVMTSPSCGKNILAYSMEEMGRETVDVMWLHDRCLKLLVYINGRKLAMADVN